VKGKLGLPLKTPVKLEGIVVEGPYKGFEDGPNIVVQRIDGKATQEFIRIKLSGLVEQPLIKPTSSDPRRIRKSVFEAGKTYELRGFEHGQHVGGGPPTVQTTALYFQHLFEVEQHRSIAPVRLTPADFVDRPALLQGTALNVEQRPYLVGDGWLVHVTNQKPWAAGFIGKPIEGFGTVRAARESGLFDLDDATIRLVHLRDQIDRRVSLRGTAWSRNGNWWLDYRGRGIHVEGMSELPKWTDDNHGGPVQIDGVLEVADLPQPVPQLKDDDPGISKRFIVRQASWKPIGPLLTPELGNLSQP
jgi:hypothetical protein